MMMLPCLTLVLASSFCQATELPPQLADLQTQVTAALKLPWAEQDKALSKTNTELLKLAEGDLLKSAQDYRVASGILRETTPDLLVAQARYELAYTAVILGDKVARKSLASCWDALLMDLGRHRPMGAVTVRDPAMLVGHWIQEPAPEAIIRVFSDKQTSNPDAKDNPEVAKMFEEDQKVRQGGMSSPEAIKKMILEDATRLKRIKELVAENKLTTANDYYAGAFLYQHGQAFEEYQMAHQLAVCSLLLGKNDAKWIGAASYDRMLCSAGHLQRWATQFRVRGGETTLNPCGDKGINESERKIVVGVTMAEAKKRKF